MHAWKQRGYQVNVWTVNEPDELRRLADLGVDGVITDDPAAARSALAV
jgi:glycerophosphoryl diester phosphodiesterase